MGKVGGVSSSNRVMQKHSLIRLCGSTRQTGVCGDAGCEADGQGCDRDAVIGDRKQVQTEFHLIRRGAQKPLPAVMKVILVISASCV